MTGFGLGAAALGSARIVVEARSVNHRFLDVRARVPRELGEYGSYVEQLTRARFARGRIDVNARLEGPTLASVAIDKRRAIEAFRALDALRVELGVQEPVPLALLGAVPDLFVSPVQTDPEAARTSLRTALEAALDALEAMRVAEGANLLRDLSARLVRVRQLGSAIAVTAAEQSQRYRARLRERIGRLLEGDDVRVDPGRLELEVAIFAEHADVSEELTRLESHARQFEALLSNEEAAGRRMDFLLQEMAREANTLGSKASETDISVQVVDLKAEVEKMREQAQNVE